MLKLYWAPGTVAGASVIVLNESGAQWQDIQVDFASGEQTGPAYLAINPKGRVPALDTGQGILTETGAILEYLGATVAPGLVPADPLDAARMREVMYYLASTMHVNHAHMRRGMRWADRPESWEDMRQKVPQTMAASAAYVDGLIRGPFLFGARMTLADAWLFTVANWLPGDGVDVSAYPRLADFMAMMGERGSVKSARALGVVR